MSGRFAKDFRQLVVRATAMLLLVIGASCEQLERRENTGRLTLAPSDVRIVGTSESIALVRDLEVLPDSSVWVLNSAEPFFIGFDFAGKVISSHGSSGGGPEEFRMPAAFVTGGFAEDAWVFDFLRHSFIRVSEPDSLWHQFSIPREAVPPGSVRGGMDVMSPTVRTARLGDELILPRTAGTMEDGVLSFWLSVLRADLLALDPRTGSIRELVDLGAVLDDPSAEFTPTEGGFPLWRRLWATCGGDHIRVYDRVRNQLRGFTSAGVEVEPIDLPPANGNEVSPRQFARVIFPLRQAELTGAVGDRLTSADSARVLNEMVQDISGEPHELAAYLPRYVDFRCASDGTMWMQPLDLELGGLDGGPLWFRISSDGVIREVLLPERFDALRFAPDRVWGVQRDELDVASVAWIELPRER